MSMYCGVCEGTVQPVQDITESGKIAQICPKCNCVLGAGLTAEQLMAKAAADIPEAPELVKRAPARKASTDPIQALRDELTDINAEVARLEDLKRRGAGIKAMLEVFDMSMAKELWVKDPFGCPVGFVVTEPAEK